MRVLDDSPSATQLDVCSPAEMDLDLPHGARTGGSAFAPQSIQTRCIHSFYYHFFSSHPFVVPQQHVSDLAAHKPLLAAMAWIGSLFLHVPDHVRVDAYRIADQLIHASTKKDVFYVQARLLLALACEGNGDRCDARSHLAAARTTAHELGLHRRAFAETASTPAQRESWRRTWWELFLVDAMMSWETPAHERDAIGDDADAALPGEEIDYLSDSISDPLPLSSLADALFEQQELSSFAYLVIAGRTLVKLLNMSSPTPDAAASIETSLSNWRLHLPPCKRDSLQKDGSFDEIMFQAHMLTHATSILLHQPCLTNPSPNPERLLSLNLNCAHSRHAIVSATSISDLIAYRTPLIRHTPFFVHALALSSAVHLSSWAGAENKDNVRELVRLNIGALRHMSVVWKVAKTVEEDVQASCRVVHGSMAKRVADA